MSRCAIRPWIELCVCSALCATCGTHVPLSTCSFFAGLADCELYAIPESAERSAAGAACSKLGARGNSLHATGKTPRQRPGNVLEVASGKVRARPPCLPVGPFGTPQAEHQVRAATWQEFRLGGRAESDSERGSPIARASDAASVGMTVGAALARGLCEAKCQRRCSITRVCSALVICLSA